MAKLQLVLGALSVIDPTCRSGTQWLPCVAVTLPATHWPIVHSISGLRNYLHSLRGQESDVNKRKYLVRWGHIGYPVCSSYHSAWTQQNHFCIFVIQKIFLSRTEIMKLCQEPVSLLHRLVEAVEFIDGRRSHTVQWCMWYWWFIVFFFFYLLCFSIGFFCFFYLFLFDWAFLLPKARFEFF